MPVTIVSPLPIPVSMADKPTPAAPATMPTGGKTSPTSAPSPATPSAKPAPPAPAGLTPAQIQKPYSATAAAISVAGDKAGQIGAGLAPGSGVAPVKAALDALSMIPGPVGVLAAAANAATSAISGLASAANSAADKYAPYSGAISLAQAQADIRETLGDMRRAREYGADLAKFVEAQSKLGQSWEDVKAKFLSVIVPVLTKIFELLQGLIDGLANPAQAIQDTKDLIKDLDEKVGKGGLETLPLGLGAAISLLKALPDIKKNTDPKIEDEVGTLTKLRGLIAPETPVMQPRADPALNMPVFGGF